jgi:hypothetical protein
MGGARLSTTSIIVGTDKWKHGSQGHTRRQSGPDISHARKRCGKTLKKSITIAIIIVGAESDTRERQQLDSTHRLDQEISYDLTIYFLASLRARKAVVTKIFTL